MHYYWVKLLENDVHVIKYTYPLVTFLHSRMFYFQVSDLRNPRSKIMKMFQKPRFCKKMTKIVKLSPFLPKFDAFWRCRSGTRPYEGFVDHSVCILALHIFDSTILYTHAVYSQFFTHVVHVHISTFIARTHMSGHVHFFIFPPY